MAQDRQERRDPGSPANEQERSAILLPPREVATDRVANLDCVPDLGHIMEEGRDLAVIKAFDDELIESLKLRGRYNRIASLDLIAIRCREPQVEMLARPERAPVLGSKEKALHAGRLAPDFHDHGLVPGNLM
jgi:hypothetical protein